MRAIVLVVAAVAAFWLTMVVASVYAVSCEGGVLVRGVVGYECVEGAK